MDRIITQVTNRVLSQDGSVLSAETVGVDVTAEVAELALHRRIRETLPSWQRHIASRATEVDAEIAAAEENAAALDAEVRARSAGWTIARDNRLLVEQRLGALRRLRSELQASVELSDLIDALSRLTIRRDLIGEPIEPPH